MGSPADDWNTGVALFDSLFREYVDAVVAGLRVNGLVLTVQYDPLAALYNTPDLVHLRTAWDEELLTKWNYDNWPVATAVKELTARFELSRGGPAPVPAPSPAPAPAGFPPAQPAGSAGGIAYSPVGVSAPGLEYNLVRIDGGLAPASSGFNIRAASAIPPPPPELFVIPVPGPIPSDPVTLVVTTVITVIGALFKLFGGGVSSAIKQAFEGIRSAIAQTADVIMRFAWRIARALGFAFNALHALYVRILRPMLDWVKNLADRIVRLIDKILRPYYEWLRQMRRILLDLYERYVRPVLVVIQTMRRVLAILAALRIPFARKLDARLAKLQQKILAPLLFALRRLNHMGGWINLLITARYLLQRAVLLNSLYAMQGAWTVMWWNAQARASDPQADAVLRGIPGPMPEQLATQALRDYVQTRSGPFAVDVELATGELRAGLGLR
jgi:hypothetical protein